MRKLSKSQQIFSLIKKKADSKFKDSLINIVYLKKSGYAIGELAEKIIVENINKRIRGLKAVLVGQKTKNQWDSKTDIVIKTKEYECPFSVKTGSKGRLKIKNGISHVLTDYLQEENVDKREVLKLVKKELSTNLFILHLNKRNDSFFLDLKKINLRHFDSIKITKGNIILKDRNRKTLIFLDMDRKMIYATERCIDTIDSIELGHDNSKDKKKKGESLLINSIIMRACLCDIPTLRKIERIIKNETKGR